MATLTTPATPQGPNSCLNPICSSAHLFYPIDTRFNFVLGHSPTVYDSNFLGNQTAAAIFFLPFLSYINAVDASIYYHYHYYNSFRFHSVSPPLRIHFHPSLPIAMINSSRNLQLAQPADHSYIYLFKYRIYFIGFHPPTPASFISQAIRFQPGPMNRNKKERRKKEKKKRGERNRKAKKNKTKQTTTAVN